MRIGILTGGGDVPGLNPAIKTVAMRAEADGHEVLGIRRGWMGLLHLDPLDEASRTHFTMRLTHANTRTIDRTGGTFLHTSRVNPYAVEPAKVPPFVPPGLTRPREDGRVDCTPYVLKTLEALGVDVLIPIGGEDTLGYGARLHREGFPVVSIPKTMDNDVNGTDFCIGFATAVTRSVQYIHQLRTTVGSHERIGVVELFGRYSGETSLVSAYLAGADRAVIPEVPFDPQRLAELLLADKADNPSNYCMVTISEGAVPKAGTVMAGGEADAFGHKKLGGVGAFAAQEIERLTGEKTMMQSLGYLMRSGAPDALDIMAAVTYAHCAMDLVAARAFGRMVALSEGRYTHVPADMPLWAAKKVDVDALYDAERYRPRLRHGIGMPMFLY